MGRLLAPWEENILACVLSTSSSSYGYRRVWYFAGFFDFDCAGAELGRGFIKRLALRRRIYRGSQYIDTDCNATHL